MSASRAPLDFFARDALVVARALIGTFLVREAEGGARVARIVETEAYRGPDDRACHARVGVTKRTRTMYGPPGRAYVFLIYGMYDCFNIVCHAEGEGHAVLVRAVEPVSGFATKVRTDGPGRLTRAFGITRAHDGADLLEGDELYLLPRQRRPRIDVSARVGVGYAGDDADRQWRFFDPTSAAVSRPAPRTIGRPPDSAKTSRVRARPK